MILSNFVATDVWYTFVVVLFWFSNHQCLRLQLICEKILQKKENGSTGKRKSKKFTNFSPHLVLNIKSNDRWLYMSRLTERRWLCIQCVQYAIHLIDWFLRPIFGKGIGDLSEWFQSDESPIPKNRTQKSISQIHCILHTLNERKTSLLKLFLNW